MECYKSLQFFFIGRLYNVRVLNLFQNHFILSVYLILLYLNRISQLCWKLWNLKPLFVTLFNVFVFFYGLFLTKYKLQWIYIQTTSQVHRQVYFLFLKLSNLFKSTVYTWNHRCTSFYKSFVVSIFSNCMCCRPSILFKTGLRYYWDPWNIPGLGYSLVDLDKLKGVLMWSTLWKSGFKRV